MAAKTQHRISKFACLSSMILLLTLIFSGSAFAQYTYTWKTDTTYFIYPYLSTYPRVISIINPISYRASSTGVRHGSPSVIHA